MAMICLFGDDEVQLSPHEIAWMEKDWDAVKKLADEYKAKPEADLFKILNNINTTKREMNITGMDYSKFMIDNMLSRHIECVPAAYAANLALSGLSDQHHHNYLMLVVPQGRRFSKTVKLDESHKDKYIIRLLMEYYKVNANAAYDYRKLLEHKGKLATVLREAKALATDEFLKTITKNPKEIKELKQL